MKRGKGLHVQTGTTGLGKQPVDVLERGRKWVLDLFNDHGDTRLSWHNFAQTNRLVEEVAQLSTGQHLPPEELFSLYLSAWFAYTGWLFDPSDPLAAGRMLVEQFLRAEQQPAEIRERVSHGLGIAHLKTPPQRETEKILWDAAVALHVGTDYAETTQLRRMEVQQLHQRDLRGTEWRDMELAWIEPLQCYTPTGKATFEPTLVSVRENLRRRVERDREKQVALLQREEAPKSNNAAIQTYFRSNYRNHIQLSAMADRKAQMMISVNAILISVLISVLSYSNLAETQTPLLIPITVFLLFGLASLVFAVLSARPKVTQTDLERYTPEQRRQRLVFFGNYTRLDLHDYIQDMQTLFTDDQALFAAMHHDLYHLGQVLDRKYRRLQWAYTLFLVGFLGSVGSFLLIQFIL